MLPGQDKAVQQMIAMLYSARLLAELVLLRQLGFTLAECHSGLDRFIRPLEQLLTLATGTSCMAFDVRVGNDNRSDGLLGSWPLVTYSVRRRNTDMAQAVRSRWTGRPCPTTGARSMGTCLTLLDITETSRVVSRVGELQEVHLVLFVGTVSSQEGVPGMVR